MGVLTKDKRARLDHGIEPLKELQAYKRVVRKYLFIDDWQGLELLMALAVGHFTPTGEMLWLQLIGPSRSGKTELLMAIAQHPSCVKSDRFTRGALTGGFRNSKSVLPRWDGKLVITKDIAAMLGMRREERQDTFFNLRNIHDGNMDVDFGSDVGHVSHKFFFDWFIGATPAIESERRIEQEIGSRFITLRWRCPEDRQQLAIQAGDNSPILTQIRTELAFAACRLMDTAQAQVSHMTFPVLYDKPWLAAACDLVARARTGIRRNRYQRGHPISEPPVIEAPTSLMQDFSRAIAGLTLLGIHEYKPYIARLVWDAMPRTRAGVIRELTALHGQEPSQWAIAKQIGVSQPTVGWMLEELEVLGIFANSRFKIDTDILRNGVGSL